MESGLILPHGRLGDCERLCAISRWRDAGLVLAMSINVSARQFHTDSLVACVARCLQQFNLDPQYLIIEITEQIFMDEVEEVLQRVQALRNLGVKISG